MFLKRQNYSLLTTIIIPNMAMESDANKSYC